MDQAIQRFVTRLSLPNGFSFKLVDCKENINNELLREFYKRKFQLVSDGKYSPKILQLFHALRENDTSNSICDQGFYYRPYGNKGSGVYLANHSRYSWIWASPRNPVIICDVIADLEHVKRYRSEVYSQTWSSEYVVGDPQLVYPKYVLRYEIEGKIPRSMLDQIGYVKHGEFGCASCDSQVHGDWKGIRCDCELVQTIDPRDII